MPISIKGIGNRKKYWSYRRKISPVYNPRMMLHMERQLSSGLPYCEICNDEHPTTGTPVNTKDGIRFPSGVYTERSGYRYSYIPEGKSWRFETRFKFRKVTPSPTVEFLFGYSTDDIGRYVSVVYGDYGEGQGIYLLIKDANGGFPTHMHKMMDDTHDRLLEWNHWNISYTPHELHVVINHDDELLYLDKSGSPVGDVGSSGEYMYFALGGASLAPGYDSDIEVVYILLDAGTPIPHASTKSLLFGGTDEYVNVSHSADLTPATGLTVTSWVKITGGNLPSFLAKSDISSGYGIGYNQATDQFFFFSQGLAGALVNGLVPNDGEWHFVAGVADGTESFLYVDNQVTSKNMGITTNGNDLWIGRLTPSAGYMVGNIDEVAIYDRALCPAEVLEIYNNHIPRDLSELDSYDDCVMWLKMGEGNSNPNITDVKGSNNGVMQNMEDGDIVEDTP